MAGANATINGNQLGPLFIQNLSVNLAGPLLNATALGYQVTVNETKAQQAALQYEKAIVNALRGS